MRLFISILCLLSVSSFAQPLQRQFFTTNTAPIVEVVAGSNATVQASTPNAQTRRFTVNAIPAAGTGQTNVSVVVAGTNILVTVASAGGTNTYTVYGLTDTNKVSMLSTNIAAYQAYLATNGWEVVATNIASYQAYLATNGWTSIATNIGAYQALQATNGLAIAISNLFLLKSGDTASGALLTTSSTTNGPANNELVTAGWVRGLFNVGAAYYSANTVDIGATNPAQPNQVVYKFQSTIPGSFGRAYVTTDFLTNSGYIGAVVTTNTFQSLAGQIVVNAYLGWVGGSGALALNVHPEMYYSYDKTNWYGDYSGGSQALFHASTNLYQWVIDFPSYTSTNAAGFYVERRFKVDSIAGSGAQTLWFLGGTNLLSGVNDASHITMQSPSATLGNAFLGANQTFTGSNQFSGGTMTWGDGNKTNGVYIGPGGEVLSNALGSVTISGGNITASGVIKDSSSYPPFNLIAMGTNVYITATNGNLQSYTMTNAAWFTMLSVNTNNTETIRLEIYGSNTLTWATANLSNAASLYLTNYTSVFLLDREAFTNLFWGYRLR